VDTRNEAAPARASGAELAQTLDRGLRLLALVAEHPEGLSVSAAAQQLGVGRTVVYRLAATLAAHDLVEREGSGLLRLGIGVLALARRARPVLAATALPVLRALADDLGATAHLTVEDGDDALALLVVEPSWTTLHVAYRSGSRHPLDRAAGGLAILAGRRGETGWTTSAGGFQSGAHGVAAPVLGIDGLSASIGVIAFEDLDPAAVGPRVLAAAAAIAARLG
jgi:DNA-binding IclR family transcriptional regulator